MWSKVKVMGVKVRVTKRHAGAGVFIFLLEVTIEETVLGTRLE